MCKTTVFTKMLSCILCVMLIAAAVMTLPGCKEKAPPDTEYADVTELGKGEKQFIFLVTDKDGNRTDFSVRTDKKTVGEALMDEGLIEGDAGEFGLYVKKVNGITADYDANGEWWGFYVNGEMSMTGVDSTDVTPGAVYEFRVEK